MARSINNYHYPSSVLSATVQISINRLNLTQLADFASSEELQVTAKLYILGDCLHEQSLSTQVVSQHKQSIYLWNNILSFPLRYRDLTRDACITLEVIGVGGKLLGGTTFQLFDRRGLLKTGLQKLLFHVGKPADPSPGFNSSTPAHPPLDDDSSHQQSVDDEFQTEKIREKFEQRRVFPSLDWLDRLTLLDCQKVMDADQSNQRSELDSCGALLAPYFPASYELKNSPFLFVELPLFPFPVVFEEQTYSYSSHGASGPINPCEVAEFRQHNSTIQNNNSRANNHVALLEVLDWECEQDNPVEDKYRTLAHEMLRGIVDPDLKPNKAQKRQIDRILISPGYHLRRDEKDLLWRFRFSLVDDRKALTKFLLCVDWNVESEVIQTTELLEQWRKRSAIDTTDALKLLGKHVAFQTKLVRSYAVDTLASAPDEELVLYLLQLVQALKYEGLGETDEADDEVTTSTNVGVGVLGKFLVQRACKNMQLANFLYWYVKVEIEDVLYGKKYLAVFKALEEGLRQTPLVSKTSHIHKAKAKKIDKDKEKNSEIAATLADNNAPSLDDAKKNSNKNVFSGIIKNMKDALGENLGASGEKKSLGEPAPRVESGSESAQSNSTDFPDSSDSLDSHSKPFTLWDVFEAQEKYFWGIMNMQNQAKEVKGKKSSKEIALRKFLKKYEIIEGNIGAIPVPLCPTVDVVGVEPEKCFMFRSALYPAVVSFRRKPDEGILRDEILARTGEAAKRTSTNNRKLQQMLGGEDMSPAGEDRQSKKIANLLSEVTKLPPSASSLTSELIQGAEYKAIFKTGDDLRQDQLIICFIRLFDKLLKQEGLDMALNPYSILATSATTGLVEFVSGSVPISAVLAEGTVLDFFKKHYKCPGTEFGIYEEVQQTYIRSCAGYCVITYLLGIGDRHLDNIMLMEDGHFFHIDFGFIFGRDPKPMPPAFRLTQQMVDGFGGEKQFKQFKSLCCQVFNLLRRSAGLVINLLGLSKEANIPDLSNNPSCDADGVIAKVEEKFRLDLSDEQAEQFFLNLINECLNAFAPKVLEVFHQISVARR